MYKQYTHTHIHISKINALMSKIRKPLCKKATICQVKPVHLYVHLSLLQPEILTVNK